MVSALQVKISDGREQAPHACDKRRCRQPQATPAWIDQRQGPRRRGAAVDGPVRTAAAKWAIVTAFDLSPCREVMFGGA